MTRPTFEIVDWASADVTLPGIGGPNKQIPILDLQQKGYDMNQKPAADEFNYVLYNFSTWLKYLDEKSGGASPNTPVIDSTPSTIPLRDANGKGCFKGIRESDTTNVRELDFTASYNGVNAIAMKANGSNIGYFTSTKLTGASDTKAGWAGNTFGNHYGAVVGDVTGNVSGTAGSAAKWTTPRNFMLYGDITSAPKPVDGSSTVSIETTLHSIQGCLHISTGTIDNGGTIPLPSGYTGGQLWYTASIQSYHDTSAGENQSWYFSGNRQIIGTPDIKTFHYMIIGVR